MSPSFLNFETLRDPMEPTIDRNYSITRAECWFYNRISHKYNHPKEKIIPLVSPCSPMMYPCTDVVAMPRRSASRYRNRAESRLVPEPMTRCCGSPLIFHDAYERASTGLVARIRIVSGLYFTSCRLRGQTLKSAQIDSYGFKHYEETTKIPRA